jgi:hypothetical protein
MKPRQFKSTLSSESVCLFILHPATYTTYLMLSNTISTCMCHLVIPSATQQGAEQGGAQ